MPTTQALLTRLDNIGRSLAQSGHAVALLGLGSVGLELDRLDDYSDLDFFVIVEDGYKAHYIDNLDWLNAPYPLAYYFRNTADGYKALYQDGIFCEFAVFEQPELATIPFAQGRIIWQQPQIDATIGSPKRAGTPGQSKDVEWLVGEALTNLYVGLGRFRRGEKLSAERFIQHYAVDRLLELAPLLEKEQAIHQDRFANERRFEQRFPQMAQALPTFVQGYDRSGESAAAILRFLEEHFPVNQAIAGAIRQLNQPPNAP